MKRLSNILVILFFLISGELFAQSPSKIKDVINNYVKVTSFLTASSVNVTSSVNFSAGDTVMIVQMKGALYSLDDPNVIDFPANMGKYELTVVNSVAGNKIIFNSPLKNTYDVSESVQLIRVPSFNDALVTDKLTCASWDGEKGGILVLIVSNSLTLNADIDVSGKGFRGGSPVFYPTGKCFATSGVPFSRYNILNSSSDSTSGKKGEGLITNQFLYTLGKGPSGNGGGAGTGSYAGGGGGGNFGIGGNGARENCADDNDLNWGGNGGHIDAQYFSNSLSHRRIYLGGGGGSGIQRTINSGSSGGNGGGVVILLVPSLITNGYSIKANGEDVTKLVTDGSSSGGGGGGGMVLFTVETVKDNLNVSAIGGNGGGTTGPCEGQGGGGGGGFVWFSGQSRAFNQLQLSGGLAGSGSCDVSSTSGYNGDSLNRLQLPLTGFLNNTIKSVNNTCYNTSIIIKGSNPLGGNGIYTYSWQYRNYRSSTWLSAPGKNDSIDYKTSMLTDTIQFRRIVSSDGMNDLSRILTINVFPQISNNVVDPDTILCFGSSPVKIRGSVATGGKGNILYEWSQRSLTGAWEPATGIINSNNFFISTDVSRYYRRKVTSDYCSTFDSVRVEILPLISNNIITPRQTICSGSIPEAFTGNSPEGGTGTYKYSWQKSNDSVSWNNTSVISKDFSAPDALNQTTYYRRIISSGLNDCCRDTSRNIKIIVLPQITNNSISSDQTICEASKPALFNGSTPSGGDANTGFRYKWEISKNNSKWDSLQYSADIKNYQAKDQDSTHFFRRIVFSGLNDCCKSISNETKVFVEPKIINNSITGDTTICDNAVPSLLKGLYPTFVGGDGINYSYKWAGKNRNGSWQDISEGLNQLTYQPPALTDTIFYQRIVTSGTCTDYSNIVTINVLNNIQGNEISGNKDVCESFPAELLSGGILLGGDPGNYRYVWQKSDDNTTWNVISGETSSQLLPGVLQNITYFRRQVKSGLYDCCQSTSNSFKISIDKKPDAAEAGTDKELLYLDTTTLSAKMPLIGNGLWSSVSDAEIKSPNSNITKITGLEFGHYAFYWTVTNGVCPSVSDSVIVDVSDLQRFTGFSPNGDGVNDFFIVEGLDNAQNKDLTVMNRWGVEVFHSSDYQNNWEGKSKNGDYLPEDTYYYILKVKDIYNTGKQRVYKGYIVLKK